MKVPSTIAMKYKPKDKTELRILVDNLSVKLYEIDTSLITDMSYIFDLSRRKKNEDFEGIGLWNVSNVEDMSGMFLCCYNFNQPLNNWDVSNVKHMGCMFYGCEDFNQPLNNWDVSNVVYTSNMFCNCYEFNQPLDKWDVRNVKDMTFMFDNCYKFNQSLDSWNT